MVTTLTQHGQTFFQAITQKGLSIAQMEELLHAVSDGIIILDMMGNGVFCNRVARKLLSLPDDQAITQINFLHKYPEWKLWMDQQKRMPSENDSWDGEMHVTDSLGFEKIYHLSFVALQDGEHISCIIRDITEYKRLLEQEFIAVHALKHIRHGIMITDVHSNILTVNRTFTEVTGYTEEEVIGKKPSILSSGKHDRQFYEAMWYDLLTKGSWEGEVWNRHKNGEIFLEGLRICAIKDDEGKTKYYISFIEDITVKKQLEEKITYQAFHDMVTKLPNRYYFAMKLEEEMKSSTESIAVVLLDLDRFKRVNDSLGHTAGDHILRAVGERLTKLVGNKGMVAHLSGDEYLLSFSRLSKAEVMEEISKIHEALRMPIFIQKRELVLGASIGISMYPEDGTDLETLLKKAELALFKAKEFGRNQTRFFTAEENQSNIERLTLESSLLKALEQDQFHLFYQPQLDVMSRRIVGAEVLLRWQHPEWGVVSPMQFIPIAEESGLIVQIDELVLRKACQQAVLWRKMGYAPMRVSVNISMANFNKGNIVDRIVSIVEETGMDPQFLTIELTESVVMNNPDVTQNVLLALKKVGIQISLDDFGTGYSSLSYLRKLPIDILKIDRSFIRNITEDEKSEALVRTIIQLTQNLQLNVVAEGVETKEQFECLQKWGCIELQGYLISRPIPAMEFEQRFLGNISTII